MLEQKVAPRMGNAGGLTNISDSTASVANRYPSHPANLLPALAEHLLLAAFGEAWAGVNSATAHTAQKLALTLALRKGGCTREPLPAWRASAMAVCEGRLLTEYDLLSGEPVTIGDVRECSPHDVTVNPVDAELAVRRPLPLPGTLAFYRFAIAMHLDEFAEQANYWGYDAARIVRLANEVDPPVPFAPWRDVAVELGVRA